MDRKIICILICTLLIIPVLSAIGQKNQLQIHKMEDEGWVQIFGGFNNDAGSQAVQTSDGGYIVVGLTESYGEGEEDIWLIKTDSEGNMLWDTTFGGEAEEFGNSVKQTDDGGYIIAGKTESFGNGKSDVWLIKTDTDGNMLWDKTFGGDEFDSGTEIIITNDGGYVIVGKTGNTGGPRGDIWLLKTDSDGNLLWDRVFPGFGHNYGSSVQQTDDGGYILIGSSYISSDTGYDIWIIKTDDMGIIEWDEKYDRSSGDHGNSIKQTNDLGYIIVGLTDSGAGEDDIWLIKTDNNGDVVWDKVFGGADQDRAYCVQQTADGGYIFSGSTPRLTSFDALLIKTDGNGEEQWTRTFGGLGYDTIGSVEQTSDGGYILTGYKSSRINSDLWIIKTDSEGNAPINNNQINIQSTTITLKQKLLNLQQQSQSTIVSILLKKLSRNI